MTRTAWLIFALFSPAMLGIWLQILNPFPPHHQVLALGLFLFALDQARMAVIDLEQITEAKKQSEDIRLTRFYWVTISTIIIELIGLYLASAYLGVGILFVLGSQVWFNLVVRIRLETNSSELIQMRRGGEKLLLVVGNLLCMTLIVFWLANIAPITIVVGLWSIAIAYASVKTVQAFQT
ncbi:MAG: hypothetical protein ACRC6M_06620 [Microcystaceae cyanobacterium]